MRARRLNLIWFAVAISTLLASVGGTQTVPKGQVVVALGSEISSLDPHMHNVRVMLIVAWHLFDNLIGRDPITMKPVPHLAESWHLIDELTWEFKLRQGVKFHNGEPFNAATVKYNFERALALEQKSPQRGNLDWLDRVDIIDADTVRLITKEPHPIVPERLTNFQMIPALYTREVGDHAFANKPVGTGPYTFGSWTKGQPVILQANTDYWKGAPAVQTVVFRTIPEAARQVAELLAGSVDLIRTIPPDQISLVEASDVAYVSKTPILRVVYLGFDCLGRDATSQVALKDLRVRQAIAHAIDSEGIIHHVLGGFAVRTATGVTPMHFGYDGDSVRYAYDPDKAKRLLVEAGYGQGLRVTLHTYSGSIIAQPRVAEAIIGYLTQVGIAVDHRHFDDVTAFASQQQAGKLNDLVLGSWGSYAIFDADMLLHPLFHRSEPFTYCTDPQLETLLERGRSTLDQVRRKHSLLQAQRTIMNQSYWVPLYSQYEILGISKRLHYRAAGDEILRVFDATWRE